MTYGKAGIPLALGGSSFLVTATRIFSSWVTFMCLSVTLVGRGSSISTTSAGTLLSGTGFLGSSGALKASRNEVKHGAKSDKLTQCAKELKNALIQCQDRERGDTCE